MAHEVNHLKTSLRTMGQYWLGKIKAQTSFQINLKCFQKITTEFYFMEFSSD